MVLIEGRIKYGGSIDADIIEKTAQSLGMGLGKIKNGFDKNTHGDAFINVKKHRNWLAHGDKSFADVGKDFPYSRLYDWKKYIIEHLEKFIISIEDYINNKEYKTV